MKTCLKKSSDHSHDSANCTRAYHPALEKHESSVIADPYFRMHCRLKARVLPHLFYFELGQWSFVFINYFDPPPRGDDEIARHETQSGYC